jgi:hypothetical protein
MRLKYARVVFCGDSKCIYNLETPFGHKINRGLNYKPFDDDLIHGICTRPDLSLRVKEIAVDHRKHKDTICVVRSEKKYSHPHFPDPTRLEGGVYDDPMTSDQIGGVYH